jgi:hypothetical protein
MEYIYEYLLEIVECKFARHGLKVYKHKIFLKTFFAETEIIWSQGPVTRDF